MTDGTNDRVLILQEVRTEASGSLVVYTPIGEGAMDAAMGGDSGGASNFPTPSGFAILPDGHVNHAADADAASSSSVPTSQNGSAGSLLTAAYQALLFGSTADHAAWTMDDAGNRVCQTISKILAAVGADIAIPA